MNEVRYVGPPGTGKSTELARLAFDAANEVGGDQVMICSLTRAAAAEIAGRNTGILPSNVGTLHSFAWRATEPPGIADAPKNLRRWNEWITEQGHPYLRITDGLPDADETAIEGTWGGETLGDRHYGAWQVARARLEGASTLPESCQNFVRWWDQWKSEEGLLDFTEMLEVCLRDVGTAPGSPSVIFMDEAQDTSMLGMRLLRKWGAEADVLAIFGDPLQNLYQWAGTDPEAFTTPDVPAAQKQVLSQSYRVPRAVHAHASAWIAPLREQLECQLGRPIAYEPRPAAGEVRRLGSAHFKYPEPAVNEAERLIGTTNDQGRPHTVMFLAACSHMLDPLLAVLRSRGLPFHNPWRAKRGDWNPFGKQSKGRDRILAYLRLSPAVWERPRLWSPAELWLWVESLEAAGVLIRGAKKLIEERAKATFGQYEPLQQEALLSWFAREPLVEALLGSGEMDLGWLDEHLLTAKRKPLEFPMTVLRKRGPAALRAQPQIVVGTIHSLKGSEADTVFLFPDLSDAGMQEWCAPGAGQDGIRRAFYVALTRARESVVLCSPATPLAVRL